MPEKPGIAKLVSASRMVIFMYVPGVSNLSRDIRSHRYPPESVITGEVSFPEVEYLIGSYVHVSSLYDG